MELLKRCILQDGRHYPGGIIGYKIKRKKKADADVLLEPQFRFTRMPCSIRELVATGFPAKFKNFCRATDDDFKALDCGENQ